MQFEKVSTPSQQPPPPPDRSRSVPTLSIMILRKNTIIPQSARKAQRQLERLKANPQKLCGLGDLRGWTLVFAVESYNMIVYEIRVNQRHLRRRAHLPRIRAAVPGVPVKSASQSNFT
jgi:hypothetical protein